jgi:hypothetical protein
MASWSAVLALSGFQYDAPSQTLVVQPRSEQRPFQCFWSTGTGWGTFQLAGPKLTVKVLSGTLALKQVSFNSSDVARRAVVNGAVAKAGFRGVKGQSQVTFADGIVVDEGETVVLD